MSIYTIALWFAVGIVSTSAALIAYVSVILVQRHRAMRRGTVAINRRNRRRAYRKGYVLR